MTISPHWPTRRSFVPDTIRAVGWAPPVAGVLLALATSGEKQPLTIRVQPDLPTYLGYTSASARDAWCGAAWERAAGLDQSLLHAVAAVAKIPRRRGRVPRPR